MKPKNKYSLRIAFIFPIVLLFIFASCLTPISGPELPHDYTVENHAQGYIFPEGHYYYYDFQKPYSHDFDLYGVFRQLAKVPIGVQDAWYKPYDSVCLIPGSNIALTVIVPPALIVRLEYRDPRIIQLGFIYTENPDTGICNYAVRRYSF